MLSPVKMLLRIEAITTSLLSLVLSFNLLLYSFERYSPPKADSPSFSVWYCISHIDVQVPAAVKGRLTGPENGDGVEKHCFCHSCCSQRHNTEIHKPGFTPALCSGQTSYPLRNEAAYKSDLTRNIPIRSPPAA
jgi:hypothetical protein